ncbi:MAG: HipA domain-containing protein, partial [Spirochaetales bacterium]|nr:HipA domain-containing protein [Spirochaetales bacterium]
KRLFLTTFSNWRRHSWSNNSKRDDVMNKCPIAYIPCGENRYSDEGLRQLSASLRTLKDLEYTADEQRKEAYNRASKMSIQGVQPKLSAILSFKKEKFEIVDKGGKYILKPQHNIFPEMPENEDLTMRLAREIGLEIPQHGLIWSKDKSLTYFIKRFDRKRLLIRCKLALALKACGI